MKYLICIVLLLTACEGKVVGRGGVYDKDDIRVHKEEPPKTFLFDLNGPLGTLEECKERFATLYNICSMQVGAPKDVQRPVEPDLAGECLWAMSNVYGDKFPMEKETRSEFFFQCIEKYPEANEDVCQFNLNKTRELLESTESQTEFISKRCYEVCEALTQQQRKQVGIISECWSYCMM